MTHPRLSAPRDRLADLRLLAGLLLATAACGGPDPSHSPAPARGGVVLDLVSAFPAAAVSAETAILELGQPAARPRLIAGWGADEEDDSGSFVWSLGATSTLEFFAAVPADLILGLRCWPLAYDGAPDQAVTVRLNGERLGELVLGGGERRYEMEIPARAVTGGTNRLVFRYAYHRAPRDVIAGARDARSLAVCWRRIELRGLGAGAFPRLGEAADRVEIPVGSGISYYFDSDSGSELVIAGLESWGPRASEVRLIVRCRSNAGSEELERLVDPRDVRGAWRISLPTAGPAIDRVELAAAVVRKGGIRGWFRRLGRAPGESGVSLVLPAIRLDTESHEPAIRRIARAERPNIIIYLIDTLRADHLGVYGYHRPTSPNIDRFAADGVLFADAQAQSSWTRPAVVSLLTGLLPRSHGVRGRTDVLPDSIVTLAEMLAEQGYETTGLVTNGNVGPTFGIDRGFEHFRYFRESSARRGMHQSSDHLNQWIAIWLETRASNKPFFLYAHSTDPHLPYAPPEPFRRRFAADVDPEIGWRENARAITSGRGQASEQIREALIDLYDAEIAFNDHHFGRLLDDLKARGLYDSSLIVLVADHGEEFLDHGGWEHGKTLYGEQLRVPLILKLPGGASAGTRVEAAVGQVDVVPTILDLLGIQGATLDGESLLRAPLSDRRPLFASLSLEGREVRSVSSRGWKLILDSSSFTYSEPIELYHTAADPGEKVQLAGDRPFERQFLSQILGRLELDLAAVAGTEAEIPDELRRQLEALGYL